MFEKSLRKGVLPSDWKEAQVTPLFKKGEKISPGNYRSDSLTSVICKVTEGIVRDSLLDHLNSNKLLSGRQHGFVSGRSCGTDLLATLDYRTSLLDSGSSLNAIYLDCLQAFDTVPHERLKVKLRALGVQGEGLAWIDDFLTNRCRRVCGNGQLSDWANVRSGVPQGCVLVSSLFVAFINDLPESVIRLVFYVL